MYICLVKWVSIGFGILVGFFTTTPIVMENEGKNALK